MGPCCSFEFWAICGTSYAPLPLDEPKFKRRAWGAALLSSYRAQRCSASPGQSLERHVSDSLEWIFAWPTWAIA